MIYYRVKRNGSNREVYTSSLNRSVSKHGYYSFLEPSELLTESEFIKVILSGKAYPNMFERVSINRNAVIKFKYSDSRFENKYFLGKEET